MDTLVIIDRTKLDYNTDKNIDGNVLGIGPMFVFAMWKKYSKINDDICVSKINLFHPLTKNNNQYIEGLKRWMLRNVLLVSQSQRPTLSVFRTFSQNVSIQQS
tara:strand:+ start:175 stop:483 length:309 start_codon:yes stop_codon:yes gene_type:complete